MDESQSQREDAFHVKRMSIPIMRRLGWSTAILRNLPDISTFIPADAQNQDPPPLFYRFFQNIHAYETHLLTKNSTAEMILRMQERLAIQVSFKSGAVTALNPQQSWSSKDAMKVSGLLFGYKLVDTMAKLSGLYQQISPPMPRRVEPHGEYLIEMLERIQSWKGVLLDFRHNWDKAKQITSSQPDGITLDMSSSHQRLFHFAAQMNVARQRAGFLQNISIAAGHLAYLKDTDFEPGELPDIPDDYIRRMNGPERSSKEIDVKFFKQLGGVTTGVSALRAVLHIGFGISPILWLHGTPLSSKKGVDRTRLINTWEALGTDKPLLLQGVEDQILRTVIDASAGLVTPSDALDNLYNNLPWPEIENLDDSEDTWFILRPPEETSTSAKPLSPIRPTVSREDKALNPSPEQSRSQPPTPQVPPTQDNSTINPAIEISLRHLEQQDSSSDNMIMPLSDTTTGGVPQNGSLQAHLDDVDMDHEQRVMQDLDANRSDEDIQMGQPVGGTEYAGGQSMEEEELDASRMGIDGEHKNRDSNESGEDIDEGGEDRDEGSEEQNPKHTTAKDKRESSGHDSGSKETESDETGSEGEDGSESGDGSESSGTESSETESSETESSDTESSDTESSDTESSDTESDEDQRGKDGSGSSEAESESGETRSGKNGKLKRGKNEESGSESIDESSSASAGGDDEREQSVDHVEVEGLNEGLASEKMKSSGVLPTPASRKSARLHGAEPPVYPASKTSSKGLGRPKPKPKPKPKQNTSLPANTSKSAGNSYQNPIDVDALFSAIGNGPFEPKLVPDLVTTAKPPRFKSVNKIVAYGPRGDIFTFDPEFHFEDVHEDLGGFMKVVKEYYVNGLPRHHKDQPLEVRNTSMLTIMTEDEYLAMSPRQSLDLLSRKHIVMDQASTTRLRFDAAGLRMVRPLHDICAIQDTSVSVKRAMKDRIINGSLQQVFESVEDPAGKFLNCLDFPGSLLPTPMTPHATELVAWFYTRGAKGYHATMEYPRAHMRWHLVSTGNTVTWVHIDSDGLCSEIVVVCGKKVWLLGGPKVQHRYTLADVMIFLKYDFFVEVPIDTLDWEAVVLTPGTRLLMRPNTPHIVLTPEPTICEGGHFYSTTTLKDSIIGLAHSFVVNKLITNTIHDPARGLLRRIAQFFHEGLVQGKIDKDCKYLFTLLVISFTDSVPSANEYQHLPVLENFSEVVDFLSLCTIVILANALDPRTYCVPGQKDDDTAKENLVTAKEKYDLNDIPHSERLEMIYARGVCVHLLRWFDANYEIEDTARNSSVGSSVDYFIGKQAAAIQNYKEIACPPAGTKVEGAPHCTPDLLKAQLENALHVWHDAKSTYESRHIDSAELGFGAQAEVYRAVRRDHILYVPDWNERVFRYLGTTPFDKKYIRMTQGDTSEVVDAKGKKRQRCI